MGSVQHSYQKGSFVTGINMALIIEKYGPLFVVFL